MVLSHISTGEKPIEGTEGGKLLSQSNTSDAYIEGENYANCWGECVVYVRGYALSDLSARIALIAPAGKTIYFDAIKIEEIKSSAYNGSDVKSDQKLDLYFPYFTTECAIFQDVSLSISFKKLRFSILFKKTSRKTENIWMVFCEELCAFASTHSIIARYFLYIITKIFLAKISP